MVRFVHLFVGLFDCKQDYKKLMAQFSRTLVEVSSMGQGNTHYILERIQITEGMYANYFALLLKLLDMVFIFHGSTLLFLVLQIVKMAMNVLFKCSGQQNTTRVLCSVHLVSTLKLKAHEHRKVERTTSQLRKRDHLKKDPQYNYSFFLYLLSLLLWM